MPSINPTIEALAPSPLTRNIGSRLWMISEEISMNMLTKPSIQMPAGIRPRVPAEGSVFVCIRNRARSVSAVERCLTVSMTGGPRTSFRFL